MLAGVLLVALAACAPVGRPIVADNMYLSLLIETGAAGLAAFLWMNGRILQAAYMASRDAFNKEWNGMLGL